MTYKKLTSVVSTLAPSQLVYHHVYSWIGLGNSVLHEVSNLRNAWDDVEREGRISCGLYRGQSRIISQMRENTASIRDRRLLTVL